MIQAGKWRNISFWDVAAFFRGLDPQKSVWLLRFQQNNTWPIRKKPLNFLVKCHDFLGGPVPFWNTPTTSHVIGVSHLFVIYISMSSPTCATKILYEWLFVPLDPTPANLASFLPSQQHPERQAPKHTTFHWNVPPRNNPKAQQKKHFLHPSSQAFQVLTKSLGFQQLVEVGRSHTFGKSFAASQIGALHTTALAGPKMNSGEVTVEQSFQKWISNRYHRYLLTAFWVSDRHFGKCSMLATSQKLQVLNHNSHVEFWKVQSESDSGNLSLQQNSHHPVSRIGAPPLHALRPWNLRGTFTRKLIFVVF